MKLTLALMALFVFSGAQGAQDPLAGTLRKGVVQEETNQNLDAAIQAYQAVLTQFGEERKTAATALFRLAECYRKQGKNEPAMAAYKRVVAEFADQAKLAEQSRTVLARTFRVQTPQAAGASSPQTEEARRRYRELTLAQIKAAQAAMHWEQKKFDLGTTEYSTVAKAKVQVLDAQARLAELDASTGGPSAAAAARRTWRLALEEKVQVMQVQLDRGRKMVELGDMPEFDLPPYEVQLRQAQSELADFDAGIKRQ
jgi:tetratricopeptide (TPR) repeat protein